MKSITVNKLAAVIFSLSISTVSTAKGNPSEQHTISYIKINSSDLVIYAAGTTFTDNAKCKDGNNISKAVSIPRNRDGFKELYASVLIAHANKRKVKFWFDEACHTKSDGGPFPTVSSVYVY